MFGHFVLMIWSAWRLNMQNTSHYTNSIYLFLDLHVVGELFDEIDMVKRNRDTFCMLT